MSITFINRLKTINRLVRIKGTGTPKQLARRLNMSESSLYIYLSLLKELGAPIAYSKIMNSYYYESDGEFIIGYIDRIEFPLTEQRMTGS